MRQICKTNQTIIDMDVKTYLNSSSDKQATWSASIINHCFFTISDELHIDLVEKALKQNVSYVSTRSLIMIQTLVYRDIIDYNTLTKTHVVISRHQTEKQKSTIAVFKWLWNHDKFQKLKALKWNRKYMTGDINDDRCALQLIEMKLI